jgi:hypothetical protein
MKRTLLHISADFLLGLLFDPENGGNLYFPNVGLSPNYKVLLPKKL